MRFVLFLLVCVCSVAAPLFLLPLLKEGYDWEEEPLFVAGTVALLGLGFVWWWAFRGKKPKTALYAAGWIVLALPVLVYTFLSAETAWTEGRSRQLSTRAHVTDFKEVPVLWPGIPGPVGLRLEIEVAYGSRLKGVVVLPPKIRMAGPVEPTHESYFTQPFSDHERAILTRPLMQHLEAGAPESAGDAGPATRVTYELYPAVVQRVRPAEKVCVRASVGDSPLTYSDGSDLGASWWIAGPHGFRVDLSRPLTDALRRGSSFQGKPDEWRRMLQRLEPDGLRAAGYRPCAGEAREAAGETCYCSPPPTGR